MMRLTFVLVMRPSEQVLSAGQSQILQSSIFHILKAVDDDDDFQQKFSNQLIHAKQLYQAFYST